MQLRPFPQPTPTKNAPFWHTDQTMGMVSMCCVLIHKATPLSSLVNISYGFFRNNGNCFDNLLLREMQNTILLTKQCASLTTLLPLNISPSITFVKLTSLNGKGFSEVTGLTSMKHFKIESLLCFGELLIGL